MTFYYVIFRNIGGSCYMFHVCLLLIQRLDNDSRDPPPKVNKWKYCWKEPSKGFPFLSEDTESVLNPGYWSCVTYEKLSKWKNKLLFTGTLTIAIWSRKWLWNVQQPKTSTAIAVQYMRTWFKEPISWLLIGYQPSYLLVLARKGAQYQHPTLHKRASLCVHPRRCCSFFGCMKAPLPVSPQPSLPLYFVPVF